MVTRADAQLWIVSTAGTDDSVFLRERVDDGRARVEAGERADVAYFEWSAPDDADDADPATWRAAMPALGILIDEDTIASDRAAMDSRRVCARLPEPLDGRRSARLRARRVGRAAATIAASRRTGSRSASTSRRIAAAASIAVAGGRRDGRIHVELVDQRSGTDWIVDRVAELVARHRPVAVALDPGAPAGSLVTDLLDDAPRPAARPGRRPRSTRRRAASCTTTSSRVGSSHLGQPPLDDAVAGARRRQLGDAWTWSRSEGSSSDPAPLIAATLARHAYAIAPRRLPSIV